MDAQQFTWAVEQAAKDTPYEVVAKDYGFDVRLDLADARWWTVLGQDHLRSAITHQVRMLPDDRYSITDLHHEVTWRDGVPELSASVTKGRLYGGGAERSYGMRADGTFGRITDYRYDLATGRDLIRTVAKENGLTETMGNAQRIGIIVAAVAGLGALVTLVVLALVFLL